MKKTGAALAVYALEQVGVRYTFGIPGVQNTELYDALGRSAQITPVLVTHEGGGAFMADAISRTSDQIGCLAIVPAAGATHAMSGIGEAYLDGVPMLVVSGGIRRDSGYSYQLHGIDQKQLVGGVTKAAFVVERHADVVPTIFEAYETAVSGEPGPAFVEIPAEVQLFHAEVGKLPAYEPGWQPPGVDPGEVERAVELIRDANKPGLYLGWGARDATSRAIELAELLGAPVATTLQGLSVFPASHPLHAGMGYGPSAVPAARRAFEDCDCLVAVGCRFAELATGSYGMPVPENLVHIDINPEVFGRNYTPAVALEADATDGIRALLEGLRDAGVVHRDARALERTIADEKTKFRRSWTTPQNSERVGPGIFFDELRRQTDDDTYMVVDDGNHTFLTMEHFPVERSKHFISPTDFNCMGYCVPAAIGTKLVHPGSRVVAVVGDGAFLMTGLEILTATRLGLGIVYFVFNDGELAQISQFQEMPLKHKTCTVLSEPHMEGVARATGAAYVRLDHDGQVAEVIDQALRLAGDGRPVVVDVKIDYSRKSEFTKGVLKVNLERFPWDEKVRAVSRAVKRHLVG